METSGDFDIDKMRLDCKAKGWLPQDLAREAGVSKMTVSRVFRGLRSNPRTIAQLAKALGADVTRYIVPRDQKAAVA